MKPSRKNFQFRFCYEVKEVSKSNAPKGVSAAVTLSVVSLSGVKAAEYFREKILEGLLLENQNSDVSYEGIKLRVSSAGKTAFFEYPLLPPLQGPMVHFLGYMYAVLFFRTVGAFIIKSQIFAQNSNSESGSSGFFMNSLIPEVGTFHEFYLISKDGASYCVKFEYWGERLSSPRAEVLAFYKKIEF